MTEGQSPLVVQIVGYKKTGKTTLVCKLVERFSALGLRVATIKHDAHGFEPDVPGTDSWKHRQAGAAATAVVSAGRTAFFEETETALEHLLLRMKSADIVLVEGFKKEKHPKLVLIQSDADVELLDALEGVVGIATWADRLPIHTSLPVFAYEDTDSIAEAVLRMR